ncbi:MAG: hypothetical protein ACM3QU_11900 [Verrucomicrobiota bacterium]
MADLPARPDLEQLRRQAKDLLQSARSGDVRAERDEVEAILAPLTSDRPEPPRRP